LVNLGFIESQVDYSLLTFQYVSIHLFVVMKDMGPLHYFLGIQVHRDHQLRTSFVII
jgi:hypothetical protein